MNNIEREEFLEWWESRHYDDEDKEVKKAAWCAWQAARQAPESGEVEPVAYLMFAEDGRVFGATVNETTAFKFAADCRTDVTPLYTHPPAKVPEDVIVAARGYLLSDGPYDWSSVDRAYAVKVLANRGLLTTPAPVTTAETEWVKCEDRLPENESTVLAYVKDYADPMVVPARYSPNSEQWFDVECVDRDGDQNTLYQVISWMPLPTPPQEQ